MYTVYVPCTASFFTQIYFSCSYYIFTFTLRSNFCRKPHYVTANGKYSQNEMASSVVFPRFVCTANNGCLLHFVLKCSAEYLLSISVTFSRFSQSHVLLMQPYLRLCPTCTYISEPIFVTFYFDVFLTVHLSIILVINQLNEQILVLQ